MAAKAADVGRLLGAPGGHFGLPGGLHLELFGSLFPAALKKYENLVLTTVAAKIKVFASPGESSKHGSKIALGHALAPLALFWRPGRPDGQHIDLDGQETARPGT